MDILGLSRHGLQTPFEQIAVLSVLVVAVLSLVYAWLLRGIVLKKDKGTEKCRKCGKQLN
jgi:K(+)-stimulated pyrophosphate-energized sodium pump